jgi:hypothetical protein
MNEKIVLRLLLFLMVSGLLSIIVIPAAHIGEVGLALGKVLTGGIVAILIYLSLRKRYRLPSLSQPGFIRPFFWLILSVPSIILVAAIWTDIYNRRLPPFAEAMQVMHRSDVVKNEIGTSVRIGWPMEGANNTSGNLEQRIMRVAIAGEKGHGYLRIIGRESDGAWSMEALTLFPASNGYHEVVLAKTSQ